jgi:exonuclease SbcC
MRPLLLTLRSFGPFTGEQTVDFTRYGDNAFLLIHGPTGAGKTTILDGICYALYGDASGEKRDEHYLRSQQAKGDTICEVEFTFQVGPRRFHIKRTPPQQVHQKGKLREVKHLVEFCQVDHNGVVLGERLTKVTEVRQRIEEVLGFTSDQFRQVVVLPQGEFRKLLLAKSDEKEQILEKLFGTMRFKMVEQSLKTRRSALGGELKELKAAIEGILSSNNAASVKELDEQQQLLATRLETLAAQRVQQLEQQKQAGQRLQEALSQTERFVELDDARSSHDRLLAKKAEMELKAGLIERAGRALNLVDLGETITRNTKELDNRRLELATLDESIVSFMEQRTECAGLVDVARQAAGRIPQMSAEKALLEEQLRKINELAAARRRTEQTALAEQEARATLDGLKASIAACEKQLADCSATIESLAAASGEVGQVRLEADSLFKLTAARRQLSADTLALADLHDELQAAEQAAAAAEKRLLDLQAAYDDLQQRFVAGQASLLARELTDDGPCPVCGSKDHPMPAEVHGVVPTDKELDKARKQMADADKSCRQTREHASALQVRQGGLVAGIQALSQQLGDAAEKELSELVMQQQQLTDRLAAAETATGKLESKRAERSGLLDVIAQERQKLASDETAHGALSAQLERCRALESSLAMEAGTGDEASVCAAIEELKTAAASAQKTLQEAEKRLGDTESRLATAQGQQVEKQQQVSRIEAELSEQKKIFCLRLDMEGFASERDWQDARMQRADIEKGRVEIDDFNRTLAAAQERLARAEGGCSGLERPDLPGVEAVKAEADRALGQLQKELGQLEGSRNAVQAALATIGEKADRKELLEQDYAVAGKLADLVGGQNPKRMTLQRYVLAALFEEVALAASQRLSRMSRGRYHLVRSEAPRDGKSTSGLDLDVTDDHTGEKRPAFTLSGGESFLASLSLALGLSDVVMAQCGGRYLDCIFIDEGFGSLDGETLDYALNTLIELHRSGRVIGIISHVAELRERITSQIEVVPSKEGSTVICSL